MEEDKTFIPGWYAICLSKELSAAKPLALKRFGLSLVLWRKEDGVAQCMLDHCPHRGAQLSLGKIKNNCIACPYHGFQFNSEGECHFSPEFKKAIPGLKVRQFPIKESMGMIWFYYGGVQTEFHYPRLEAIHQRFCGGFGDTTRVWHSHITYCIENQLDYTHLPDVHHNTIGRGFKYPENPIFAMDDKSIVICFDSGKPVVEFFFPNVWVLNVSDSMQLAVYFAPIDTHTTKLYLRSYYAFLKFKPLKALISLVLAKVNLIILKQDERVVSSQGSLPSYCATHDMLMKNDKAVKFFRDLWRSQLKRELYD